MASKVVAVTNSPDVVATLYEAGGIWGLPASLLTDNGAVCTPPPTAYGYSALESELFHLGIDYKHSRPYHPQTCGKVERFHQTLKRFLSKQEAARTIEELQAQIDRFITYTTTSAHTGPRIASRRRRPSIHGTKPSLERWTAVTRKSCASATTRSINTER